MSSKTNEYELAIKIAGMVEKSLGVSIKDVGGQINELGSIASKASSVASGAFKTIGGAVIGLGATLGIGSASFLSYDDAYRQMIASTGAGVDEAKDLQDVLESVYSDNFGESWEDVANAIATVKKNISGTKEEIQQTTEDAFTFRDTFGYEINESVRSSKTLMDQFGITSREAYTLMAQGAQNGLDYSGELLDSINEYSVQFAKFGFSAEDMFNIFNDGATSGAFNLDKIGDAVKENAIRAIDGSKASKDAFVQLGFDADEMAAKFASGGTSAKEAFEQVSEALQNIENPVKQNGIGIELFGTMWEDLGPKVVTQLGNIGDNFNKTTGTINKINEIKYTSFSSALTGIKRRLETAFIPIGKALIPLLNNFADWINKVGVIKLQEFADKITEVITGVPTPEILAIKNTISTVFDYIFNNGPQIVEVLKSLIPIVVGVAGAFLAFKAITSIMVMVGTIMKIVGVIKSVIFAFQAFAGGAATFGEAIALVCNPVGLVIAAVVAFIGIIVALYMKNEEFRNKVNEIWGNIQSKVMGVIDNIKSKIAEHQDTINTVLSFIQNVLVSYFSAFVEHIGNFINMIADVINGIIDVIFGVVDIIVGICNGDWAAVWEGIKEVVQGAIETITGLWGGLIKLLSTPINAIVNLTKKVFGGEDDSGEETVKVGHNAKGTKSWKGGLTYVNEGQRGELINLPNGTQITSHSQTESLFNKIARANAGNNGSAISKLADKLYQGTASNMNTNANLSKVDDETPMIHYNPTFQFYGEAPSKDDMVEASRVGKDEFDKMMKQWMKDNKRINFA